jgi:hypothetical protein
MLRMALFLCAFLLVTAPVSGAKLFENPETVSYLQARVVKEGSITLESTGIGARATSAEIRHSVPQETYSQEAELRSVTGPDEYSLDRDDFGNDVVVLTWNEPPLDQRIDYEIVFGVRVWSRDDPAPGRAFPETELTEASQEITEKAYEIAGGLGTREKFMELTSYVYDIVEYDRSYQNVQKSAGWVFDNRKAVCDGHANLLISMLRALGYNAYYVIGYAYTEENTDPEGQGYWGPHGWVEVEHDGMAYSLDPTWMQHPVDATHIKFDLAPDSNYTEYVQLLANNVRVNWEKGEYVVSMLDSREEPRVDIESRLLPGTLGSEQHSLLVTDIRNLMDSQCILTRIRLQGCTDEGRPFLTLLPEERDVGFCGNETIYWLLGTPRLQPGIEYTCGVNAYGAGEVSNATLIAAGDGDMIETRMSTAKVMTPGQFFRVNTTVENHGLTGSELELFVFLGDSVQGKSLSLDAMQAADIAWSMRAPREEGSYHLRFFSSSGDLIEEVVRVIEKRRVEIAEAAIPVNMSVDESLYLNVTLKGLEGVNGELRVSMGDEEHESEFSLEKDEEKTFTFVYTPGEEGVKRISMVVLSGEEEYEDGLAGSITVFREREWWEGIWEALRDLLEGLFRLLGMSG